LKPWKELVQIIAVEQTSIRGGLRLDIVTIDVNTRVAISSDADRAAVAACKRATIDVCFKANLTTNRCTAISIKAETDATIATGHA
jgi:hypothetical protein